MVKLSIIVPVYNVEKYLRKCVFSLVHQDFKNYEIILVDDGSTDGSGTICDTYVSMNDEMSRADALNEPLSLNDGKPLIRVIHQKNGGLSVARNTGLKAAKGEYVCFVDSDDYWQPNVLNSLMAQIERDNLDVLRFKYQNVNEKYEVFNPYKRDSRLDNDYSEVPTDGVSFLNSRMNTQCYAVMFIIKRSLLVTNEGMNELTNECLFKEGIYFEDTDWTPRMLVRAKRVASTDTIVYNYLMREGSITNAVNRSKQQKVLDDKMRLVCEMQRQAKELAQKGISNVWFSRMIADTVISIVGMLSSVFYAERKSYLEALDEMSIYPIKGKSIKVKLINFSPYVMVKLLHFKNQ